MAEGINVRFVGAMQKFIQQRTSGSGLYSSASEYIRDLVRHDFEQEQQRRRAWLHDELSAGLEADESEFIPLNAKTVILKAKARRQSHVG